MARLNPLTRRTYGYLAAAAASSLWGLGFYFGKVAFRTVGVEHMVLYRFLFAAAAVLSFLPRRLPRFSRRDWWLLLVGAFFGVPVQFLLQFRGLSITTLAHASLMVGTVPVVVAVGASVFLHERLDRAGWAALAGSSSGALLIALSRSSSSAGTATLLGDGMVLLAMLLSLVWILCNRKLMDRHDARTVTSYGLLTGTLMLTVWVLSVDGPPPIHGVGVSAWLALAASGVLCTTCTTLLWNWSLTQIPASEAGVFLNLEPMIGTALSVWLFGERLGWTAWLGAGMIVVSATVLTTRSSRKNALADALPVLE